MRKKPRILLIAIISLSIALAVVSLFLVGGVAAQAANESNSTLLLSNVGVSGEDTGASSANIMQKGGIIYVSPNSTYEMTGGEITGHNNTYGGAVYVAAGGTFKMTGGVIRDCEAIYGGAVYVESGGTCIISGGQIKENRSNTSAVFLEDGASYQIANGTVFDNVVVDKYTINFYIDGILKNVKTVLNTQFDLENEEKPLEFYACAGYFYDVDMNKTIENNVVNLVDCEYVENNELNLYTKEATIGELEFTLDEETESYMAAINTSGNFSEVVFPAEHNMLPVSAVYATVEATGVTNVVLPSSLTIIKEGAFKNQTGISTINIPSGITSIEKEAFMSCSSLSGTIEVPEGVTTIEIRTFNECELLNKIILPNGITEIKQSAFAYCESLEEINIPASLTTLGATAFSNCGEIVNLTFPEGIKKIGSGTFSKCESLETVNIPSTVTEIVTNAFSNCASLTEIVIPASVTKIGKNAFTGCSSMTNIYCEAASQPENWNAEWLGNCAATVSFGYTKSFVAAGTNVLNSQAGNVLFSKESLIAC